MGPHDLLCKWCSTFVGKGKKFCSIFCESRYTRSKRRKLAFRRPVYSSGTRADQEYESPRSNKTAPAKKGSFLEDVITAVENTSPERDKRKPDDNMNQNSLASSTSAKDSQKNDLSDKAVPKLDLSSPKEKEKTIQEKVKHSARGKPSEKDDTKSKVAEKKNEERKASASKPKQLSSDSRSKTQTLLVSKIPVRNNNSVNKSEDLNNTVPLVRSSLDKSAKDIYKSKMLNTLNAKKKHENEKEKTDSDILNQAIQRQKSKTALEYEKRIRSSGYGNPVNPRLRPLALKPKSATVSSTIPKLKRDSSAKSSKSSILVSREDSRSFAETRNSGKWELVPTTIKEETGKKELFNGNKSLEDEDPTPGNSPRKTGRSDDLTRELAKIHEISREETTHSDLLSQTELQIRLSSIKKKVEVRKRGRDSRSSVGSELDSSFQDSTTDLSTERDVLNTSMDALKANKTSRNSARSNITRISKQFKENKQESKR